MTDCSKWILQRSVFQNLLDAGYFNESEDNVTVIKITSNVHLWAIRVDVQMSLHFSPQSNSLQFVIKYEIVHCSCKRYFQLWLNCHEWHLLHLYPAVYYSELSIRFDVVSPFETTSSYPCPLFLNWTTLSFPSPFAPGFSTTGTWLQPGTVTPSPNTRISDGLFTLKW